MSGLRGTLTIRTRPVSPADSIVKSEQKAAAVAAGKPLSRSYSSLCHQSDCLERDDQDLCGGQSVSASEPEAADAAVVKPPSNGDSSICPPKVRVERFDDRKLRRKRNLSASDEQMGARRFVAAPARRQPDEEDGDAVVSYGQDLISAGWVFVVRRVVPGKNWLAPDETARSLWRREPGWGDVLEMLETPSEYLSDEVEISIHADKGGEPALTRPFLRPPPTDIGAFQTKQYGYAKFYFESVGPEELVLLSFHEGKKRKGQRK